MSPNEEPTAQDEQANTVLAGRYRNGSSAMEHGLVILSMNLNYWHVLTEDHQHELYVEPDILPRVRDELQAYALEQQEWPPPGLTEMEDKPASFYVPYILTLVLIGSFLAQGAYTPNYLEFCRMDSVALLTEGEWWRPFTALFLHGDAVHLMSNLVFGIWYGRLVNQDYGTLLGWVFILLTGMLGNTLVALWHYPELHLSIGASTSVFGALGLLVAHGMVYHRRQGIAGLGGVLIPMIGGGVLLGWTGGYGTPEVDGLAHSAGFLIGVLVGCLHGGLLRTNST